MTKKSQNEEHSVVDAGRRHLLAHVADLYYRRGWSQQQIADSNQYSRSAISRLLTEAREAGVVEIRIHRPVEREGALEASLSCTFPELRHVEVHPEHKLGYSHTLRHLGAEAARYVQQLIGPESVVGVSWGTATYEVVNALHLSVRHPEVQVVQLIGALNTTNPEIDGPGLARHVAGLFGSEYKILPAPLYVENEQLRDTLSDDPQLRRVLELANRCTVAIVGIGTLTLERSSLVRAGYLGEQEVLKLAASGLVGDVCGIYYDVEGNTHAADINRRRIGISVEGLREIPVVVGVATGASKVAPIHGALRAGLVNSLFIDKVTAAQVLSLAGDRAEAQPR